MRDLTVREAEDLLGDLPTRAVRDDMVRTAYRSGVTKARIHALTGLARSTIDTILARPAEDVPQNVRLDENLPDNLRFRNR